MTPIDELLNRIRWDRQFVGGAQFEIGYWDRVERAIQRVPFQSLTFPLEARRVFELTDESGQKRRVPLHRVREVVRDGQVIWKR